MPRVPDYTDRALRGLVECPFCGVLKDWDLMAEHEAICGPKQREAAREMAAKEETCR